MIEQLFNDQMGRENIEVCESFTRKGLSLQSLDNSNGDHGRSIVKKNHGNMPFFSSLI